jgi:hypothetical protein
MTSQSTDSARTQRGGEKLIHHSRPSPSHHLRLLLLPTHARHRTPRHPHPMHEQIPRPARDPQRRRPRERQQRRPAHVGAVRARAREPRPRAEGDGDVGGRRVRGREAHLGRPAHGQRRVAGQALARDEGPEGGGARDDGGGGGGEAEGQERARDRGELGGRGGQGGGDERLEAGAGGEVGGEREDVGGGEEGEGEVGEGRVDGEAGSGWLLALMVERRMTDDLVILGLFWGCFDGMLGRSGK